MSVPTNKDIGTKIRLARKQAGLTQKQFGQQLGKSGATVAYIEQGQRRVNAGLLKDMAQVLKRPLSFFYEEGSSTDDQLRQQLFALKQQLGSIQDILATTEKKKEEAEADAQLFRKVLDHCNDIIAVWDPETGKAIDCNQKTCESLGYSRKEFLQKTIMDVEPGIPTLQVWKGCVEQAKKMGYIIIETFPIGKDGKPGHVEVNVKYVSFDDKDYMVVIAREMTERKRHEELAQQQTQKYHALLERSPMGVMTCDNQGKVVEANKQLYDMLDIPESSRKEKASREQLDPLCKAGVFDEILACLHEGKSVTKTFDLLSKSKQNLKVSARIAPTTYTGYITGVQVMIEEIGS